MTAKPQHTPGPWAAFTADGHTNIVALAPRTQVVFSLPGRDKNEPDVMLATAAPDLLAFADLVAGLETPGERAERLDGTGEEVDTDDALETLTRLIENARAAIAAAKGGAR